MRLFKWSVMLLALLLAAMMLVPMVSAKSDVNTIPIPHQGYWISVDNLPLKPHFTGDSFTISGRTNLPVGREINYGAYISMFEPGSPNLLPPSGSGTTLVTGGIGENRTWSFVLDTTLFRKSLENGSVIRQDAVAGNYILSIDSQGGDPELYPFTLATKTPAVSESPSRMISDSPINPVVPQPTTVPATLTTSVPFTAVVLGIFIGIINRK